ncbi:Hypothetical predicted protein [Cloeon dipterum]|uniref:Bee-milk protein n=1 Tax=Cloeon dipterum TaxID=197152 RepID=A0A8S1DBE4_9INSE|nr:Hypothetical predicted protein [Cloeon dipterum]
MSRLCTVHHHLLLFSDSKKGFKPELFPTMTSVYLLALLLCLVASIDASMLTTIMEWDNFDITRPSEESNQDISENIQPNFMAVFGERLFLSLQRLSGISATLAWLPVFNASSRLHPFPSWNLHNYGNCERIQTARGLEVDPFGRLWLLDDGSTTCPATLWIFNLIKNDTIELVYTFPDAVVSHDFGKRLLHDLVVLDSVAYITDVHSKHLVVFSLETKESWSVETQGKKFRAIALSPESNLLFLARHNSRELYSVAQFRAKDRNATLNLVGSWKAEPYRMVIDGENVLFAAFHDRNYISTWNITEQFKERRLYEEFGIFSGQGSLFCFALDSSGTFWTLIDHGENKKPRFRLQKVAERIISGPEAYVSSDLTTNKSPNKDQEFHKPVVEAATCLAEDYHRSRFLNLILICSNVFTFFAMGAVIVWLLLKRKNSKCPDETNKAVERQQVFVLYDEIVKPVPWNPADYGYVTANILPPWLLERPREYEEIGLVKPEPMYRTKPSYVCLNPDTYTPKTRYTSHNMLRGGERESGCMFLSRGEQEDLRLAPVKNRKMRQIRRLCAHLQQKSSKTMSLLFASILLLGICLANAFNFTTVYKWDKFDFIWPTGQIKDEYKPENVVPSFMAVFGERLFLSLGSNTGIPATLVWLPTSGTLTAPPKLAPFPSWRLHKKDNCDSIQMAKGVETDPDGRLWVLDDGGEICPSKIWIFDLSNKDKTERIHQFPDKVISLSYSNRYLRDIVLDKTTDGYLAYITDYFSEHIVVYNRKMDKSWSVQTPGRKWLSLALSPDPDGEARQLYLARADSKELYSVCVSELKNEGVGIVSVKFIGEWTRTPYRMLFDSANILYAAFYDQNYTSKWNISEPFREKRFHEVGRLGAHWQFSFALDTNGNLWMTERNVSGGGNRNKLLKAAVGAKSYQFGTSTVLTSPQTASAVSLTTILIGLLVIFLVLSCAIIAWLTLRMRRIRNSSRQIPMDTRAEIPDVPAYDDVAPETSTPENPDKSLHADAEHFTLTNYDYVSARSTAPHIYDEPSSLIWTIAGNPSEPEYEEVCLKQPENIYDDVAPEPSSAPSGNKNSGRKPAESTQYLEMKPYSTGTRL